MKAIVLSIGDELVLGQTVDTNSAWLSQQLAAVGCDIAGHITVPDDQQAIQRHITEMAGICDFLIISGGIGPTEDDLTRQALAAVLNQPLEMNQQWVERLETFFTKLGRKMPETNKIQAMIPRGVTMVDNPLGTASGMDGVYQSGDLKTRCRIFVMPGVPKEMKGMFTQHVLPLIREASGGAVILSRTLHTFGLGESTVAERLGSLMDRRRNPSVGTTVSGGIVSLRVNARASSREVAERELEETSTACRTALGSIVFGQDGDTLPMITANLLKASETPRTVTTAESCTGGLLAKMLTDIPGSSSYFAQGWVTYSNQAKYERLGVSLEIINLNGAVSEPVVDLMARNARRLAKADYALAISGIAGPDGGGPNKPVGTVWIALAYPDPADKNRSLVQSRVFIFTGDREMIRDRAAKMALTMLRFKLLGQDLPF